MQKVIGFLIALSCCCVSASFGGISPDSPIVKDWMLQDGKTEADAAYIDVCRERRNDRLKTLKEQYPKIVFTKHFDIGGSFYAYTEAQSDAQNERNFVPGSALCLLELGADNEYHERILLQDKNGVIRDPAVTFDGKKIVFAWKKSDRLDDYHLYDYEVETGKIRQLTFGLGYADYEPCPLPNGDIVFNSTRCVQIVDCWWTEVSNIHRCDQDGKFLRRLAFDQVHTNYPSLMDDGRIVYTRWDYNDRGQIFPQGLFQMNADGTAQTEYYGNNSWFPTTLMHTRVIPGTGGKSVSVIAGHHTRQYGKLGIIDPMKGRQENSGVQLIAPVRETTADRIDAWGQWGDRFAHPYPINEREFIVSYNCEFPEPEKPIRNENDRHKVGNQHTVRTPFGIYWIDTAGQRELLVNDPTISCNQPFPLAVRNSMPIRDSIPVIGNDSEGEYGTYTMQDVYFGPGLEGVERGTAKTLRVVALDFRSTGIGANSNHGPSGGAMVSTPISISHGTWDVKIPLGDVPIMEDGSASFKVPARTPVYFQILDKNGHCIQTMRSWSTLQPGETFSCIGCHEDKNVTTQQRRVAMAQRKAPQKLKPFYGQARGFSFVKEIQPILDKHCIACHQNNEKEPPYRNLFSDKKKNSNEVAPEVARNLVSEALLPNDSSWHYTTEPPAANWMTETYFNDTAKNLPLSEGGFGTMPGKRLATEWNAQRLWAWTTVDLSDSWKTVPLLLQHFHDEDIDLYVNGKRLFFETGHTADYEYIFLDKKTASAFKPGKNILAVHVIDTGGGRGFDLGLWYVKPGIDVPLRDNRMNLANRDQADAFSLKGDSVHDPHAGRNWSRSYLNLTNAVPRHGPGGYAGRQTPFVNWINVQDVPSMLPPYKAGSARSDLLKMLDPNFSLNGKTHHDVDLSREELDKLAAWVDLLVPFCGDYKESNAWSEHDLAKFEYYENKKKTMQEYDRANLLEFVSYKLEGIGEGQTDTGCDHSKARNSYRNLALNPGSFDAKEDKTSEAYPVASSNSVCRGEKAYAASNCLDGKLENRGHGEKFPSWGPEQNVNDLWWKVDFGKAVLTDQIVITIRADFPHDTFWKSCTVEFSNGFKQQIKLQKTADRQIFRFPPQKTEWVKLSEFEIAEPGWAALTEVEVMGVDRMPRSYCAPGTESL